VVSWLDVESACLSFVYIVFWGNGRPFILEISFQNRAWEYA
jgi:hypothetical protein